MEDYRFFSFVFSQNYLKDAWNVFDFVTVLGSITDILVTEINVRALYSKKNCCCGNEMIWVHSILETTKQCTGTSALRKSGIFSKLGSFRCTKRGGGYYEK